MTTWSTDHLPPRDRFEYWREERARRLFGVEAEIAPERRLCFTGRATVAAVGPATLVDVAVSSYTMRRTWAAFKPTGESFARYVAARRLARADRMLTAEPGLPVTQVAYACGLDGPSTFFRRYRAAYGISPGERRTRPAPGELG